MKQVETFYTTYDWMVDIGLSSNDLNLYALIFSFTREGNFWMASRSYLAKRIGCSVITVYKSIQFLQDNGLLEKREVMKGNVLSVEYKAIKKLNPIKKLNNPIKKINSSPIKKLNTNNKDNNNIIINTSTTTNAHTHDKLQDEIDELKRDMSWKESICMNHKIEISRIDELLNQFKVECLCNGEYEHLNLSKTKYHFNNWLYKKEHRNGNKRNNPIDNIERAQQQAIRESMEFIREAKERDSQVQDTIPL